MILIVYLALQFAGTSAPQEAVVKRCHTFVIRRVNWAHGQTAGMLGAKWVINGVADVAASSIVGEDLDVALGSGASGAGAICHTAAAFGRAHFTPASTVRMSVLQTSNTIGVGGMTGNGGQNSCGILGTLQGLAGITGQTLSFGGQSAQFVAFAALAGIQQIALLPLLQAGLILATGTTHQIHLTISGILGETVVIRFVGQTGLGLAARTSVIRAGVATKSISRIREGITFCAGAGGTVSTTLVGGAIGAVIQLLVVQAGSYQILSTQSHQALTLAIALAQVRFSGIGDTARFVGRIAESTAHILLRGPGVIALIRLAGKTQSGILSAIAILVVIHIV